MPLVLKHPSVTLMTLSFIELGTLFFSTSCRLLAIHLELVLSSPLVGFVAVAFDDKCFGCVICLDKWVWFSCGPLHVTIRLIEVRRGLVWDSNVADLRVVVLCYFHFCFLVFSPESLPGDDVLCRLLSRPRPSVCFLPCFCCCCFSPTVFVPGLFWCNFLYLVTTAGIVADQLM